MAIRLVHTLQPGDRLTAEERDRYYAYRPGGTYCRCRHESGFVCTRATGHHGPHLAVDGGLCVCYPSWPLDDCPDLVIGNDVGV